MTDLSRFASAAREIAGGILAAARSDDDSVHWLTATFDEKRQIVWRASPGLYSGAAGIALFLLDASELPECSEYRDHAIAALSWCFRWAGRSPDYSFYGGRMGIAYAMLRAFAITGDSVHLERALRLGEGWDSNASADVSDLLGGVAGSIVGFLHLHQQTHEAWTIDAARALVRRLVASAHWTPAGLCWDLRPENVRGLCGFSHGAAGIAFALLEAAEYLGEPAYRRIALEALRYEASYYNAVQGSWPDFRKLDPDRGSGYSNEQIDRPEEWLIKPGVMDAWCHGAPGIALSRLRAVELLGPEWSGEAVRAIARTRAVTERAAPLTFTLCHGACGNAAVFLEAARVLGGPEYVSWAEQVGDRAIDTREREGKFASGYSVLERPEDLSLMMGNAGIGEFFLNLAGGGTNILLPRLTAIFAERATQVSEGRLALTLAKHVMPRSMAAIEANDAERCASFFAEWRERSDVLAFIAAEGARGGIDAEVLLESEKLRMLDECPSLALVAIMRARDQRRAGALAEEEISSRELQLASFSVVWRQGEDTHGPRLLRITGAGVEEIALTEFSAAILEAFATPATIDAVIRSLEETLQSATPDAVKALHAAVNAQILAAIGASVLVVSGS